MTDHALLLVNLGSPASTKVADVRSYLNQFLMDLTLSMYRGRFGGCWFH